MAPGSRAQESFAQDIREQDRFSGRDWEKFDQPTQVPTPLSLVRENLPDSTLFDEGLGLRERRLQWRSPEKILFYG